MNTHHSSASSSTAITPYPAAAASTTSAATPIPSEIVAQCTALLDQVEALIGPVTSLSADDIHRSLKRRKGAAQVVTDLVALCDQHGVSSIGPISVEQMTSAMSRALALHTIGVALTATHKMLDDAKFTAWSDTWQNATAIYTILQRLALVSPTLALGLQPVQAFFKTKKTKGGREGDRDEGGSGSGSRVTEGMRAAQGFLTGRIPVEQRGIEHEPPSAPIVDDRRVKDATEATRDDARRPEVSASAYPGADAVEAALAEAIRGAASAGEWATVAALARELEARRVARAGNVVTLSGRTKHRP